jgi:hypothetical protein
MSNISRQIDNFVHSLTIAAGAHEEVDQMGRYFILKSNTLTTDVEIAFGGSQHYTPWPVLWPFIVKSSEDFFDKVKFHNPAASAMTIEFLISTEMVQSNLIQVTGVVAVSGSGAWNTCVSDPSVIVLPADGYVIDAGPAVNVGGGVVGIPLTGQPFVTGDAVTISNCPQYNGNYTVLASSGANQVDITAAFQGGLLDNAAAVDKGGGLVGIPITGHPYTAGETIRIANTTNYNGDFTVDATTTVNEVVITSAYVAETFDGVNDSHNLVFDNADDSIALTASRSIAADTDREELHITNHDETYKVFWGDANVNAADFRGIVIQPDSTYIIATKSIIYLACEDGAGVTGCRVSWNHGKNT